ncbi:MAG: CDP-diacylglycerol--serine O-phosphatidyltransferase [Gammaproteobacteria bacterium]|nr:CDP-diacylglycerol--serine O-phosphatidyltransferase [Gammaproteobacteria bacterium]MCW8922878.1 CDP-diacylglycerol--serine O-phosphatidyltransferase [Gammaproteobacteria bacterium]
MNKKNDQQSDEVAVKPRRRGVYLLPNLLTTAALFAGFYAIVAAMNGKFEPAAIAVFVAMVLDGLDGRVARMTNTQSAFGAEYDSLSDMISFGLAPALVMYIWSLSSLVEYGWQWGKLGWLGAFIYVAAAALRLARFNTKIGSTDKRYFQGLPSPAAAAVVIGMVWVFFDQKIKGADVAIPALVLTVVTGLLMVSNISFYSFKDLDFKNKVPFIAIFAIVLIFVLASIDPPKVLFGCFLIYALSGPVVSVLRRIRKRSQRQA